MNFKKSILFIAIVSFSTLMFAQWNTNPSVNTTICATANNQQDARIVSDSKSGAIITWVDYRNSTTNGDIYAQRIHATGYTKWASNGIPICNDIGNQTGVTIDAAGNGSTVFAWNDWRNGNKDIYVQKVDSSGNIQWIMNGVGICIKNATQADPKIINDGNGGAIVVWQDSSAGNWDIYAQRINSSGSIQWTSGGVAICAAANSQINPKIESNGQGGAIIVWQDKRNGLEYDIYAQSINASGAVQWATNGIAVCSSPDNQTNPKIESDNASGAYIAWQDKRNGNDYNIYAQRISSSGTDMWTTNGVAICTAIGQQSAIDLTSDFVNGVIISWKDERNVIYQIYANGIDQGGTTQWSNNGINIGNGINPNIIGDNSGGAIITWQDSTTSSSGWNVYAQKLTASGAKAWINNVDVAIATGGQTSPKNVPDGNGGSIFCWQDKRVTNNLDIYAHHLNSSGLVSVQNIENLNTISSICYPNPVINNVIIKIISNKQIDNWHLKVYNSIGGLVFEKQTSNSIESFINTDLFSNGIYFYNALVDQQILSSGTFVVISKQY